MDLYEAMSTLRAVRRLKPDPIPDEVLKRILTAATWAPSGGNRQCWRVIAVKESGLKEKLSTLYRPHWLEYTKGYDTLLERLAPEKIEQTKRGLEAGNYLADHLQEAPIICVFCFKSFCCSLCLRNILNHQFICLFSAVSKGKYSMVH